MDDTFDSLQSAYIDELRALKPELYQWWMQLTGITQMNEAPPEEFETTWPVKISGHPRLLEVFRRYYMKIEDLNDDRFEAAAARAENPADPSDWMEQTDPPSVGYANPVDLLVWDLQDLAPDVFKMAAGVVFVPVGLNQHDERV